MIMDVATRDEVAVVEVRIFSICILYVILLIHVLCDVTHSVMCMRDTNLF